MHIAHKWYVAVSLCCIRTVYYMQMRTFNQAQESKWKLKLKLKANISAECEKNLSTGNAAKSPAITIFAINIFFATTTSTTFWRIKDLGQLSILEFFFLRLPSFWRSFSKRFAFHTHFRLCLPCFTAVKKVFPFFCVCAHLSKESGHRSYEYALGSFA